MTLLLLSPSRGQAVEIVKAIGPPMIIINSIGVAAFLAVIDTLSRAREKVEGAAAQLAVHKIRDIYGGEEKTGLPPVGTETGGKLPVWANGRLILLNTADIFFAKAAGKRNTLIVARKGQFSTGTTLRELEAKLSKANFIRTHKSYLVNAERIEEIVPWFNNTYLLVLQDCPVCDIPVARHYVRDFNLRMRL